METRPTIPMPPKGECGCGCGEQVRNRYRPGHDARHKSLLLDVARRGIRTQAERAAWTMVDKGWGKFVDDEILDALPMRNRRGHVRRHVGSVERWLVEADGTHHCNAACPDLQDSARRAGAIHPISKLARPSYTSYSDEHPQGFDQCQGCAVEETVLEMVQRTMVQQWLVLDALDQEAGIVATISVAQRRLANTEWAIEPDLDEHGNVLPITEAA